MHTRDVDYAGGDASLRGYLAFNDAELVLTGADDPLAPPDQVVAFENEMRAGKVADWQVISYGNTLHGFTNPAADGSMMRTAMYNEQADRRSWASMKGLFDEVLT